MNKPQDIIGLVKELQELYEQTKEVGNPNDINYWSEADFEFHAKLIGNFDAIASHLLLSPMNPTPTTKLSEAEITAIREREENIGKNLRGQRIDWRTSWIALGATYKVDVSALLDHIEAVEKERDECKSDAERMVKALREAERESQREETFCSLAASVRVRNPITEALSQLSPPTP